MGGEIERIRNLLADAALAEEKDKSLLLAQAEALMRRVGVTYDDLRDSNQKPQSIISVGAVGASASEIASSLPKSENHSKAWKNLKSVAKSILLCFLIGLFCAVPTTSTPYAAVLLSPDLWPYIAKDPGGLFGAITGFGVAAFIFPLLFYCLIHFGRMVIGKRKEWSWKPVLVGGLMLAPIVIFQSYREGGVAENQNFAEEVGSGEGSSYSARD